MYKERSLTLRTLFVLLGGLLAATATLMAQDAMYIDPSGNVGIGTSTPVGRLHLENPTSNTVTMKLFNIGSSPSDHWEYNAVDAVVKDHFLINKVGSGIQELRLDEGGKMTIAGPLFTGGPSCGGGCDLVFDESFALESIEEHAEFMWENKHLRGVGPTQENAPSINLSEKVGGLINELEKAHIYIEQLHTELQSLKQQVADLAAASTPSER